jgi:hypothetical protein
MLRAAVIALALIFALPAVASGASIASKCDSMVDELNARRDPNVRLRALLCDIAHSRSIQQAKGIKGPKGDGHWIQYVVRRLNSAGVCWRNVGEAIAWTTATPSASRFLTLWWASDSHRTMLASRIYDRAGGSWRASLIGDGRTYATLIVADFC